MFAKGKVNPSQHVNNTTLIAAGTAVQGNIKFSGNIEIEGRIEGDISSSEPGQGTVRVLAAGVVEGRICAPTVIINGTVNGDVYASDHVELAAKAMVTGNVHYKLIEMVKGAQVNGSLVYSGDGRDKPVRKSETNSTSAAAVAPNT